MRVYKKTLSYINVSCPLGPLPYNTAIYQYIERIFIFMSDGTGIALYIIETQISEVVGQ
jgi:hypothetical protein